MDKVTDAAIFSRAYNILFTDSAPKVKIEELAKQLIQDISRLLSHSGIILGHIKLLAKISEENFLFLSVTRLDSIDIKASTQWLSTLATTRESNVTFDINVLIYGYSPLAIKLAVDSSLTALCSHGFAKVRVL